MKTAEEWLRIFDEEHDKPWWHTGGVVTVKAILSERDAVIAGLIEAMRALRVSHTVECENASDCVCEGSECVCLPECICGARKTNDQIDALLRNCGESS